MLQRFNGEVTAQARIGTGGVSETGDHIVAQRKIRPKKTGRERWEGGWTGHLWCAEDRDPADFEIRENIGTDREPEKQ